MRMVKKNLFVRKVHVLLIGLFSAVLLSCEKSIPEPGATAGLPVSDRAGGKEIPLSDKSVVFFQRKLDNEIYKVTDAESDAPVVQKIWENKGPLFGAKPGFNLTLVNSSTSLLYFIGDQNPQKFSRIDVNGNNYTKIADFPGQIWGRQDLKYYAPGKQFFWIQKIDGSAAGQIVKSDASGLKTQVIYSGRPQSLDIDQATGKIYFYENVYNGICSIDTNGNGLKVVVKNAFIIYAGSLRVDPIQKKLYWVRIVGGNAFDNSTFCTANMDGTGFKVLWNFENVTGKGTQIEIDPVVQQVYYTRGVPNEGFNSHALYRRDFAGKLAPKLIFNSGIQDISGICLMRQDFN